MKSDPSQALVKNTEHADLESNFTCKKPRNQTPLNTPASVKLAGYDLHPNCVTKAHLHGEKHLSEKIPLVYSLVEI